MEGLVVVLDATLLASTVRLVSPILLAALGGLITERAGIFNVALEGLMLIGAFVAVVASSATGNPWLAMGAAALAGVLAAGVFGIVVVTLRGDPIVAGLALNLLALGSTTYLMRVVFGVQGGYDAATIVGLPRVEFPFLAGAPVLGTILSGHSVLVWASLLAVVGLQILLFRHPIGLHLRAVGEDPVAAGSLGIRVQRMRYAAILASGALCGLAGAQLSLGLVTQFVEGMTVGRGFIALVAVMFGRANPVGVLGASVFFGFAFALGLRLQGVGIPPQFVGMLPYVATIAVLVFVQARARARRARSALEAASPDVEVAPTS